MRKLASIRKVSDIIPIDGADSICSYKIDGWNVVDTIGKYNIGDLVIYIETDAWIPNEIAPFLSKGNEPKEFNGVKGERLRTIKLRKTLSQGLILPLYGNGWVDGLISKFATYESVANRPYPVWIENVTEHGYYIEPEYYENDIFDIDLSAQLNIQKWEPPIPAELSGIMKGNFPSQIPKTDEERCLSGDTIVDTVEGKLTIKHIVDNKLYIGIYSYNHELNEIEIDAIIDHSIMSKRKNEWLKLTTKDNRELYVTKNHRIWCDDISAYRCAKDLLIGQKVLIKTD